MALHEFYLEQRGPTRVDLDEPVVERLRSSFVLGVTKESDIDEFFEEEGIFSFQDRCYYIIAAEGDPDTFYHWDGNWSVLYSCLRVVFVTGHWGMTAAELEEASKKSGG